MSPRRGLRGPLTGEAADRARAGIIRGKLALLDVEAAGVLLDEDELARIDHERAALRLELADVEERLPVQRPLADERRDLA